MLPNGPSQTYRLIGIRGNHTRQRIGVGLSKERVTELLLRYIDLKLFASLAVENEEQPRASKQRIRRLPQSESNADRL